ncbi:phosphotransferase [Actinoplanes sp. NBRC 103695]|uniref:phosphotransferase n=1 Tax=Actinoplanes sp. NBRC 103695 TaxID=3032202 RepID=UPI0024A5BD8A|nr:phosphotransferase [Actinoplanes sp. NBRC 103695]GLY94687.1 hypothetical protein Acsp02_19420 [Actinoplanes sp. NBRC 103695]
MPADPQWQPGRGHRLPPEARSEEALVAAAELLRQLHEAARTYRPTNTEYRFHPHPPRKGEVVSHGDLGPWNTAYRDGRPVAFIDWDAAGPIDPLVDLAAAAWEFVPLGPPEQLRQAGFDPLPDIADRLRLFVDAYGLSDRLADTHDPGGQPANTHHPSRQPADTHHPSRQPADTHHPSRQPADTHDHSCQPAATHTLSSRRAVLPALQRCRLLAAERVKFAPVSAAEAAEALEHHARELRWLQSVLPDLARALPS